MLARNVPTIYASRLISGLGYGIAYTAAPMYLGEIASDECRGAMATLITVMSKVRNLFTSTHSIINTFLFSIRVDIFELSNT